MSLANNIVDLTEYRRTHNVPEKPQKPEGHGCEVIYLPNATRGLMGKDKMTAAVLQAIYGNEDNLHVDD